MFTRTIIAGNPSFANPIEVRFWEDLKLALNRFGWSLLMHSMRKIDDADDRMILPARLKDVANFLANTPRELGDKLPPWLSEDMFNIIVDWEHRRWELRDHNHNVPGGLHKLAWHVDTLVNTVCPAFVMTTNKIDHGCSLFNLAALHYGAQYLFVERSPLNSVLVEPSGMFAESLVFRDFDPSSTGHFENAGEALARNLASDAEGFRPQDGLSLEQWGDITKASKPLILLPLDNALWTSLAQKGHPQSLVDYPPDFRDMDGLVRGLAKQIGDLGGTLLLKLHPAEREPVFAANTAPPSNVIEVREGLNELMRYVDGCVVLLSKVAFPALAMDIPTAILSTNTAAVAGKGHIFSTQAQLTDAIEAICQGRIHSNEDDVGKETFHRFLGWSQRAFYVDVSHPIDYSRRNILSLAEEIATRELGAPTAPAEFGVEPWAKAKQNMRKRQP